MKYLLMVRVDESIPMTAEEKAADLEAVGSWVREMDSRGVRLTGDRLRPVRDSVSVRVRHGDLLVSDGPFAETKEQMGGFDLIECDDVKEAIEIASRHPGAAYGTIELRPIWQS
ncbi:YciI family protein [Streptomyces sp. AD681]|uniref:YciI family protein n=1 Tax=Streptomyces TaxID=1883 RepID=UPI0022F188D6|nr:YciI family protein [Streptomyces sp. AD681]MDA5139995.1 YciI family protein [Streptomyces sp. AD681]